MKSLTTLLSKEKLAKFEKIISFGIYYILPVIAIITLISAMTNTNNLWFSRQEWRWNLWRNLLAIILFVKPITFLAKKYLKNLEIINLAEFLTIIKNIPKAIKNNKDIINSDTIIKEILPFIGNSIYSASLYIMRLRRPLGVATFWLLLTHGFLWEIFWIRQGFGLFFNIRETVTRTGILGLIALAVWAITSNNYAILKLKKNWKKVQMIAYIAFFFGAIHTWNILLMIIYFVAKYIERKDSWQLSTRKDRWNKQITKIKTNRSLNNNIQKIKNNKYINSKIDKIKNNKKIKDIIG